jgi:hypothetical protein
LRRTSQDCNRDKMSDGYTENDTDAGYQDNYMGGMNTIKEQMRREKKSLRS